MDVRSQGRVKRAGQGEGVRMSLFIGSETVGRLEELSLKAGISRSQLIRNLIEVGLEEAEFLDKIGVLGLVTSLEKFRERVRRVLYAQAEIKSLGEI